MSNLSPPFLTPAFSAATVTVAVRLFHRQRAICYWLASFIGSFLLALALPWVMGQATYVFGLAAGLFWLLPLAAAYIWRASYIKPAMLSFTPQGLCLEASDKYYQVAWADLVGYQVEFSLTKLVGAGYRLKLWETQGHTVALNLLEHRLIDPDGGLRADSAVGYLCRYIGGHNRQAAAVEEAAQIVYRPSQLSRKTGVVLLTGLGVLALVDVGFRLRHPTSTKGHTLAVLAGAATGGLQALGQRRSANRYDRYLRTLQEQGSVSSSVQQL